ncbi:MAG TPA: metallophosphoesterase [Fibrobacteria bacterium]|nr:metallophosphoesterase [Fibrobacteria bacterium]
MTLTRLLVFLGIVVGVLFLIHFYIWRRVVVPAALPMPWNRVATVALFTLMAVIPLMFLTLRSAPNWFAVPVAWIAYVWIGLMFYLFVFGLAGDLLRGSAWLTGLMPRDPERRSFALRLLAGGVASAAALTGIGGILHAARGPKVKRVEVPLAKLPAGGDGYVIAQLTDIHIGPTLGHDFLETVVRETNALGADMIVITGDLVDGSVEQLREKVAPLADLRARDGVFFITGNHEYYSGAAEWCAHLGTLGVRVLRNEHVDVRGLFDLAGVDDRSAEGMALGHKQDIPAATAGRDTSKPLVLLAHQPKAIAEAAAHGTDLMLSGHVHGGQIMPFNWLTKLDQPYVQGLYRHADKTWIYVSPGTGYWGPPMRVGTTSEITRITLRAEPRG